MCEHAVIRKPGVDMGDGLTTARLGAPDPEKAAAEHEAYADCLRSLGVNVIELPPLPGYPDAHFVEDTAVITTGPAVITRPGAESRRGEEDSIETVLAGHREIVRILPPGTVDGGDVLRLGRRWFIGLSERTNREGAGQLGSIVERQGCSWTAIPLPGGLHLKSSVNRIDDDTVIATGPFAVLDPFAGYDKVIVDEEEEYAANLLSIKGSLIIAARFPRTRDKLVAAGHEPIELEMGEMRKMDGGLTCLSLRIGPSRY